MKRKFYKKIGLIVTSCILALSITSGGVYAASESNYQYATVNGYSYKFYSDISQGYKSLRAGTYVGATSGSPKGGYMGALARVYTSNGVLYDSSDWEYNNEGTVGMNIPTYAERNGIYYSHGRIKLYNGNGYNTYDAYKSPNMTLTSASIASMLQDNSNYQINDNGETYGSGLQELISGVAPDLIKAYGSDGTLGYVRSEDLELEEINTPEEAMEYQRKRQHNSERIIPLYEVDGETVIGTFKIKSHVEQIY